ncbi:casein kinase II subunit beta [Pelomyxa schiedti]|nr:casein kinase II subunit beta [Pelomyxa schiedti]
MSGTINGAAETNVSESSSTDESNTSWIQWYTSTRGNELFCEVDEEFINDQFNLYGLSSIVPGYAAALDIILDNDDYDEAYEEEEDEGGEDDGRTGVIRHPRKTVQEQEMLQRNAELLYGLIHARFIQTSRGMALMLEKYRQAIFGKCPRYLCNGQPVLPVGLSDIPRQQPVRLYCPRCEDVYIPKVQKHTSIDGAYFGTSFPHMLLLQYPELVPPKPAPKYVPKIFGFKIRHSTPTGCSSGSSASLTTTTPTSTTPQQQQAIPQQQPSSQQAQITPPTPSATTAQPPSTTPPSPAQIQTQPQSQSQAASQSQGQPQTQAQQQSQSQSQPTRPAGDGTTRPLQSSR